MSIIAPFVTSPSAGPDAILEAAATRWAAILAARPDLEPALDLQRRLITIVVELNETVAGGRLATLSLPPQDAAAKLARGVPALAGERIEVPDASLKAPFLRLGRELAAGGAGEAADHICAAIESGRLDIGSLLAASLARDQNAIRAGAVHLGLAPDLLWLIAELAVGPWAHALQRALFAQASQNVDLKAALDEWDHGYCPACGSWPALAEVVGGHRILCCSFCAEAWELKTYSCVYCGEAGEPFVTAAPDPEQKTRRVEVCGACAGYLKTIDVDELSPFPLLAIADLETNDLDVAAMTHGYRRPTLKEFSSRRVC